MATAGDRLRALAAVLRGERAVTAAMRRALQLLLDEAARSLASSGMDPAVLNPRNPVWSKALAAHGLPAIEDVFLSAFAAASRGAVDPSVYATRYLEAVHNRLSGVADEVYDSIRSAIVAGREAEESIPQIAQRVDALLTDEQRWTNRAVTIARTETIGANNMGARDSAAASAALLGEDPAAVIKEWLATLDSRTRDTHKRADGQQVMGLDTTFDVGGRDLLVPGDPHGPAEEVVNCRCTALYVYPGDPEYAAAAEGTPYAGRTLAGDQRASTTAPAASVASTMAEPVVDSGPASPVEYAARTMTVQELQSETRSGSTMAKKAARAELRRRGVTAALIAAPTQEDPVTTTPPEVEPSDDDQDDAPTSVIVAALPAASDPVHGIGDEPKHATLLFFGSLDPDDDRHNPGLTDEFRTLLSAVVAEVAGVQPAGPSGVTGVESLGDDGARVWMLDQPGALEALRGPLMVEDLEGVRNAVEQFPSFTPHVTIGYPDPDLPESDGGTLLPPEVEEDAAAVESITFDRLAVWWGTDQTEWPLTGGTEQEDPVADQDTTDVAAGVLEAFARHLTTVGADYDEMLARLQATFADVNGSPVVDETPVPAAAPGTPEAASDIPTDGQPFYGILWPEDVQSGDGRGIARGATTHRDLPLPVMAQDAQQPGHDGAVRSGRIDVIERDETTYTVPVIRYSGYWDTSEVALETARQVDAGVVRGISVDGDAVQVELRGSDGSVLDPMTDDFPEDGVVLEVAVAARVSGGTVCSIPAFHQAYIANGTLADRTDPEPGWNEDGTPKDETIDSGAAPVEGEVPLPLVASAGAPARRAPVWSITAGASVLPVVESRYFSNPGLDSEEWTTRYPDGVPLTVDDDGRVYGHLAKWGTCHIGIDGYCQEPPVSASNYAHYAKGVVLTETGERVRVGPLTMGTGHADMRLGYRAAAEHYDNTGSTVADVAIGQDGVGIWYSGRVRPSTTPDQVYALAAAGAVSGDWREVARHSGDLELVAALVVNVPGFAMPRPSVAASAASGLALVAAGMVQPREAPTDLAGRAADVQTIAAAVVAHLDRRTRHAAAQARVAAHQTTLRTRRAAAAAARLNERV